MYSNRFRMTYRDTEIEIILDIEIQRCRENCKR